MISASLLAVAAAVPAAQAVPAPDCSARLEQARVSYSAQDIVAARAAFAEAAAPACRPYDHAAAELELARIALVIDGDPAAARTRLEPGLAASADPCPAALMIARARNAAGEHEAVGSALAPWLLRCRDLTPGLGLEQAEALLVRAATVRGAERRRLAREAETVLDALPPLGAATLAASRHRLAAGLLAGDAALADAGWRGFFWLDRGEGAADAGLFGPAAAERRGLSDGLAPGAPAAVRLALARLLVRAGFDREAGIIVADAPAAAVTADWRDVRAYLDMRRRLVAETLAHDRAWAAGRRDDAGYQDRLRAILGDAVAAAGGRRDDLWPELRRLWNLHGTIGNSVNVPSLHLGHVSIDRATDVAQDARRGSVRFIALDNMIANSYFDWIGDGRFGPGGWAADGAMIQVRYRYVQIALDRAAIAFPGPARDRYERDMRERTAGDDAIARATPIAFLTGLAHRIGLQAVDDLAREVDRLRTPSADRAARLAQLWYDRSFEGTIVHHEGRHVLDQAQFSGDSALGDAELEYRAKLSELIYSVSPRVSLSSIYNRQIGGETGHGIANERLLVGLVAWMERNRHAIAGFDPARPTLPQLDLLTDAQFAAVARTLDPELQ